MARSTPRVERGALVGLPDAPSAIVVGTPAWYAWLEGATVFAFSSPDGGFTARKERSGQTGWYWKAYRKRGGTLQRAYLGKSADLSLERLSAIASELAQRRIAQSAAETRIAVSVARAEGDAEAPAMSAASLPSGTVTFLFTDIEGSTQLWEQQNGSMPAALARHDILLRQAISAHGGVVFKTVGDGCHAVFARAPDALAATMAAQRTLHAEAWGTTGPLRVRMALHTGAAEARDGDYYGSPLNRVAGILAAAHGGQVLLSRATHDLVADDLPAQASLRDLGEHALKDLSRPEQIFQLLSPDLPSDFPPLRTVDPRPAPTPAPAQPLPLLATKLYVPLPRANLVRRSRLVERLQAGLTGKLTLIAAPAGFGKTTLVSAWRATPPGSAMPVAWVSLDAGDNDATRFWSYVIAALETVYPDVGVTALALLRSPQPPPIETILAALLNAISTLPTAAVLVLDDYHLIDAPVIHEALATLIGYLPPHLHLVIATRVDPPFPLARWRARGAVNELRATDLRFTPDEAAAFLMEIMGLPLTSDDVAALEARTEGWIAGLQFAALAMRDRADLASFIAAFAGSNRFVVDYLTEEVVNRLPRHLQTFLLQTAILDRMCGPLCDTVVLGELPSAPAAYSQSLLEELEYANVFMVALDDDRKWYRYHHLFAAALRDRLHSGASFETVATLHCRASAWYERQGLSAEAIQHALAGRAFDDAARMIEQAAPAMLAIGGLHTLSTWMRSLPSEVLQTRPRLSVQHAWFWLDSIDLDGAERCLADAEQALRFAAPTDDTRDILGDIATARSVAAALRGNPTQAIEQARAALEHLSVGNLTSRGIAATGMGMGFALQRDMVGAASAFGDAAAINRSLDNGFIALKATTDQTYALRMRGAHQHAITTCQDAIRWSAERRHPTPIVGLVQISLADLLRERHDLDAALRHADEGIAWCAQLPQIEYQLFGMLVLAHIKQARHDLDGALEVLRQAGDLARSQRADWANFLIDAFEMQLRLAGGRVEAAARWAERPIGTANLLHVSMRAVFFALTYEHVDIAQAQALIARSREHSDRAGLRAALELLDRQRSEAEAADLRWGLAKTLALQALAYEALGEREQALAVLSRALDIAAPEGYVQILVEEGAPMNHLLRAAHAHGIMPEYIAKLLATFGKDEGGRMKDEVTSAPVHPSSFIPQPLLEPLTDRELEVLRLMAAGRSNTEIAHALVVAVSTIKTHVNRIFGKLGVTSRTQAVARARELHLL